MLADLLRRPTTRLVTVLGPGGVGKSRLASSVAVDLAAEFTGGVAFVPLAAVGDADLVLPAIASALRVRDDGDSDLVDQLVRRVGGRRLLLILDTFEHVTGAAPVVSRLLASIPSLTVVVTSRAVLNVTGERVVRLSPFAAASGADDPLVEDAVRLFVERASAASSSFFARPEDGPTIAAICDRLDGLPLAIELAAARTRLLSPAALLERLGQRLTVLDSGPRDAPDRLRTMRAAITWSYDLLGSAERALFRLLGVFDGGCTPPLIEAFASRWSTVDSSVSLPSDVLSALGTLVDQSLLVRQERPGVEVRLTMLDSLREFALGELTERGELDTARRVHAPAYLEWAEYTKPLMFGSDQVRWLDLAEREQPNLRAALACAIESGDAATAVRLASAVLPLWGRRGHFREGRGWLERALALPGPTPAGARAVAYFGAGMLASVLGDLDGTRAHAERGLAVSREVGDVFGEGLALLLLSGVGIESGELETAERDAVRALARFESLPDRPRVADALQVLADVTFLQGDHHRHAVFAERHVAEARRAGDLWNLARAALREAASARWRGDLGGALPPTRDALELWRNIGDAVGIAAAIEGAAFLATACGDPLRAVGWLAASASTTEALGAPASATLVAARARTVAAATSTAGRGATEDAWRVGGTTPIDVVIAEALAYEPETAALHRRPPRSEAPGGLTAREVDVLRLVADGSSNRTIAEALGISHQTAAVHLGNILNKLGLDSRTAAAAFAIRQGIA